jgi:hypothetical protein
MTNDETRMTKVTAATRIPNDEWTRELAVSPIIPHSAFDHSAFAIELGFGFASA